MLYKLVVTKQKGYRKVDFSSKVEHFWTLYCDLADRASPKLYHMQNSKTTGQAVKIQTRRLMIMSWFIWIYAAYKSNCFLFYVTLNVSNAAYKCIVVVVVLLFYVHCKHLRSCRDGQLT